MTTTATAAYSVKRKPGEPPRPSGLPAAVPKAATQARAFLALLKTEVSRAELVHQLENAPATAGHAGQGVIRHHDRETFFLGEQLVDVAQQRAAAGEHDATLGDVRAQLRRSLLERLLHGTHDALQRLLQRLEDLVAVQRKAARHAFGEVAALYRQFAHLLPGIGRTDFDLDALGGRLADEDAVVAAPGEVPPPISSTIEPRASCTGSPAPTAAAIGSLTIATLRAPAPSADSRIARRSTWVEPNGTHTSTRGEGFRVRLPGTLLMKCCSIFSV